MYLENQGMTFFLTDALARNHSEGEHHHDHSEEGIIHYHAIKQKLIGSKPNHIKIETQYPEIVNIDGEIKGNTSLEIIVHKQKLKVIC
jgi:diacylglycerol kinase family enzyme